MKAVILAGGAGTRLRPITYEIPKPLVPVKKKSIITYVVEFLNKYDISEIAIIISEGHIEDFKIWKEIIKKNIKVLPVIFQEKKAAGTFACLREVKSWIGRDDFISINGDSLMDFDLHSLISFHNSHKRVATAAIMKSNVAGSYFIPKLSSDNLLKSIERKPVKALSEYISSGVYIFTSAIFSYDDLSYSVLQTELDIFPKLIKDKNIFGFKIEKSRFYDCGTLESWEQAIKEW
jgi:mannose-1-phosphate guanylyltransferase